MTEEEVLIIAKEYGLDYEVQKSLNNDCSPEEAAKEWDLL